jgi:hypothetical protein
MRPFARLARRTVLTSMTIGLTAVATRAQAAGAFDDPYVLPDAPRSMSLPELTHPDMEWTATSTVGVIHSASDGGVGSSAHTTPTFVQSLAVEVPIGLRRWFAGAEYKLAGGQPPEVGGVPQLVGGNFELYGRTVWATRTGLAFGGGLGLLPAIASYARAGSGADVALAAATLEPWDYAFFQPGVHTLRTFVDVRDLVGPFVIQLRLGFNWSLHASDLSAGGVTAATTLYLGWRVAPSVGVGIEASELYLLDSAVEDRRRAHFTVAPSVRFVTANVQPALSAFAAVGDPLYDGADSVWGVRFAVTLVIDPRGVPRLEENAR